MHPETTRRPIGRIMRRIASTTAIVASLGAAPGYAQNTVATPANQSGAQSDDSSERIALAGQLRMLSQRVVSAACFFQAGLEAESSGAVLTDAVQSFERITAALEFGDAELGITGAEDRRRTLAGLAKLNEVWAPIAAHAATIRDQSGTMDDVAAIAMQSAALFDIADRLVAQITSQYALQTTVLQSDAVRLDVAGRQRMLSQQIAKNGCLVSRGIDPATSSAELGTAAESFGVSMNALQVGLQDVGILPPPNDAITESLAEVARNWSFMSRIVNDLVAGNTVDDLTLGVMFLMSNQVTDNMEKVVDLYAEASKL